MWLGDLAADSGVLATLGITVSVDAFVTDQNTYNLYNNQTEYARLGAQWLFEELDGSGTVYYMRGLAGHPADDDRHVGFQQALAEFPDIEVVPSIDGVHTGWDPATTTELINNFMAGGQYAEIDGIKWYAGTASARASRQSQSLAVTSFSSLSK